MCTKSTENVSISDLLNRQVYSDKYSGATCDPMCQAHVTPSVGKFIVKSIAIYHIHVCHISIEC